VRGSHWKEPTVFLHVWFDAQAVDEAHSSMSVHPVIASPWYPGKHWQLVPSLVTLAFVPQVGVVVLSVGSGRTIGALFLNHFLISSRWFPPRSPLASALLKQARRIKQFLKFIILAFRFVLLNCVVLNL
jgi:hypothetical protein